jgi:Inner membrane component of T3SS, cytoplasmic domain
MSEPLTAPIWIEVTSKASALPMRQRITGDTFSVGRGYQNDLIIDDPAVSSAHVRFSRDETGAWWIDDLASDNGTVDMSSDTRVSRLQLTENAALRIGHTLLTVRSGAFVVPAAIRMTGGVQTAAATAAPSRVVYYAFAAMLLVGATSALSIWLKQTGESKVAIYVFGVIMLPMMALGWALAWALVTRIVAARGQFFRHLLIVGVALLAMSLIGALVKYADYTFAFVNASTWESAVTWLAIGALLAAHLRVVVPNRVRLVTVVVGVLIVAAISMDYVLKEERQRLQPPQIVTSLLPSFLPTKPPVSTTRLFEAINALKPDLEEERKKDPPQQQGFGGDVD